MAFEKKGPEKDTAAEKMPAANDTILIIPAYNEAGNIERVVDELTDFYPQFDYIVVSDGPTDGTDEICRKRGYHTLFLPENMGLEKCFSRGMQFAWENGYAYAVQFDGDGQHRPEYIGAMRRKALEGYTLVQGSRFCGGEGTSAPGENRMSTARRLGSALIRAAIFLKTGRKVTDPTCGMRLYGRELIGEFAEGRGVRPEPDTVTVFLKRGISYAEVPVKVQERENGESYLRPLKAAKYMWRMLSSILRA